MKKIALTTLLAIVTILGIQAQETTSGSFKFDKSKLELGGNFGFSFGKSQISGNYTSLNISPQVGYRFHPKFSAGFGPSYIYRGYSSGDYSENYGGLTFYGRYRPIRQIQILAQPEFYRTWGNNFDSRFVSSLLLGAGVIVPVGSGGISFSLAYDVLQNDYSPYWEQIVYSVGYVFSF
ncbi:hypothetical protein LJC52_03745 [Bacteroidales bacterium OttesenSCG-928-A17]|nr:hypothetical protein [Bacteroidales bacterium OttesenSCG-928-A17]